MDNTHAAPAQGRPKEPSPVGKLDPKAEVLANRLFLKIYSVPSLQSFLADASVSTEEPGGKVRIELDFLKLPKEILPELEKLLSLDWFKDAKLLQYIKNGQGRTGIRIEVDPRNLPGDAMDYAF